MQVFKATATRGTIFSSSLIALALSFVSAQTFAADCKGKFCVGNWVIDSDNSIGQLTGFPDENTGRYKLGSSAYDAPLSRLRVEVPELDGLKPRNKIVDSDNSIGVAVHVFEDSRVQYRLGSSSYVTRSASPEVAESNFIRKGTVIIDSDNSVGAALAVFANKKVQYQLGSSTYVTSAAVGEVGELNGLKAGRYAIDSDNSVGVVAYVFRDGRVQYKLGTSKYVSGRISPEVDAKGRIKAGSIIIDSDNSIGTTLHVFADGRVQYQLGSSSYVTAKAVAATDSLNGLQTGLIAIDSDNSIGKVQYIFEDGRANYRLGSSSYVSNRLVPSVDEVNGLKAGLVAVDSDNSVGTIQYVFRDGRASYKLGSSTYVSSKLSKEVDSHPSYQKGVVYATTAYAVGKAVRFFENQKVQLELLSGGTAVGKELFAAADEVEGYQPELVITDSQGREGIIKVVFANGAVAYQLRSTANDEEKAKLFGGKVYAFFLEQNQAELATLRKEEEKGWLIEVARMIAKRDNIPAWGLPWSGTSYLSVTMPENMPEIKKALLERLFEEPELIADKNLRKKVREHLSQ